MGINPIAALLAGSVFYLAYRHMQESKSKPLEPTEPENPIFPGQRDDFIVLETLRYRDFIVKISESKNGAMFMWQIEADMPGEIATASEITNSYRKAKKQALKAVDDFLL